MLVKNTDADIASATFIGSWWTSDDTTAAREARGLILAKGLAVINQSSGNAFPRIFIRRKTLARLGKLREGDELSFIIAKDAPGATAQLTLYGNINLRVN